MFTITHTVGRPEGHDTYEAAVAAARREYGDCAVIGHDGDLEDGGDRTLCWSNDDDAENDDGANAVAVIRRG